MPTKVLLFGERVQDIRAEFDRHPNLSVVEEDAGVVVCYGGDGTLLAAERKWPGTPKVPIRNSRRGNRCIAHPAPLVIERLADSSLVSTEYMKLECEVHPGGQAESSHCVIAVNEINVHMGRINSAVRFRLWCDDEPYGRDLEIIGDGFVVSTPFGSTAYFNHLTQGIFHAGLGIAFKATTEQTGHLVVHEDTVIRIAITRGPAILGYDNCPDYIPLNQGDVLLTRKHENPAILLTWDAMRHPSDAF